MTPTSPEAEVRALQGVARVLEAAHQERDEHPRRTGCTARAPQRRCPCSRSSPAAGPAHRARGGSPPSGSRRRSRRSRPRGRGPTTIFRLVRSPRTAPRAASPRSPAPRTRTAYVRRAPRRRPRRRRRGRTRRGSRSSRRSTRATSPRRRASCPAERADPSPNRPPVRLAVEDQVVEEQRGAVVEHQRRDDLVRVGERPQQPGNRRPRGPQAAPATIIAGTITNVGWSAR